MLCRAFKNIVINTFGSSFLAVLDFHIKEKTGFDFSESILRVPDRAYYALLDFFQRRNWLSVNVGNSDQEDLQR